MIQELKKDYVTFDNTGKIIQWGNCQSSLVNNQAFNPNETSIEGLVSNSEIQYVSNNVVINRPINPASLFGTTISNLINPSIVSINGKPYMVTDTIVDLTFPKAGKYEIIVSCWPYLDANFTVTV